MDELLARAREAALMPHVPPDWQPEPQPVPTSDFVGLGGLIRSASSFKPDTPAGRRFLAAAVRMGHPPWLAVQFSDPATNDANVKEWQAFRAAWQKVGVVRLKQWWRVQHRKESSPPQPQIPAIPNPEKQHEFDRMPLLLQHGPSAVATLGKAGGLDVALLTATDDLWVLAECFRETPTSDHTIANSYVWWESHGFDMRRWVVLLQAYGQPFASIRVQAQQAKIVGARGVGVYPLEGASPSDFDFIGEVWAQ